MRKNQEIKQDVSYQIKYLKKKGRSCRQIYAALALTLPKHRRPNLKVNGLLAILTIL
jgi:hypothetical protein